MNKYVDELILLKREKKKAEKYNSLENGYYIAGKIVQFHEEKVMKNFSMYLPNNMGIMSDEIAKIKYPSEFRPKVIFTTLDLSVNMGFSLFHRKFQDSEMEKMCERIMSAIKREHMDYRFYGHNKMDKISGYRFSFRSHAMDSDLYNMMLIAQLKKHTVLVNFNCLYKDYENFDSITNEHHQVTCDAFMFCRYGVGIVYITDNGQVQGEEYLGKYVVETVTGARLILDSSLNPQGIPLYSGPTMNGVYESTYLTNIKEAQYAYAAISTDDVYRPQGGYYKFVHAPFMDFNEEEKELIRETYNPEYHGSFKSKNNEFSIADNRIEVALREDILCKDGEAFTYYLGGKYVDIILSDGTTLACIVGDAKGNEDGSSEDGTTHYDGSIVELLGINNENFSTAEEMNCNRSDLLHGEDIVEIRVYTDKKLYTDTEQYVYYFSDYNGDIGK